MIAPGSPYTVTVFCLDVWPEVTSERHPVMVLKSSDTSLFARPSNGGALTLTFILLTTALIFLFLGIGGFADSAVCSQLLMGIAALANFVLTLYLAFALADEKLPCY